MLSLPQVLHEAQRHSVDEIVVAQGEPVTFHGEQGALVLGDALTDSDISEALSQSLAPEQQAELAVAGVVEFYVEGYAGWSLVAESTADGVVIRGQVREGGANEVGAPMDLPPLRAFDPVAPEGPQSSSTVPQQSVVRSTRWDLGIAEMADYGSEPGGPTSEVPAPPEYVPVPPRVPSLDDEDDDDAAIDFALVGGAVPADPLPSRRPSSEMAMDATIPRVSRSRAPADANLAVHAQSVGPGTVVYVAGTGVGEALLEHLEEGFIVVDEDTWTTVTTLTFNELPLGQGYLVRLEDPSRCLPWLLRRVEEGARVVVEGRSLTSAGARRTLLGAEATAHLERWLDAHPQRWFWQNDAEWTSEPTEPA